MPTIILSRSEDKIRTGTCQGGWASGAATANLAGAGIRGFDYVCSGGWGTPIIVTAENRIVLIIAPHPQLPFGRSWC